MSEGPDRVYRKEKLNNGQKLQNKGQNKCRNQKKKIKDPIHTLLKNKD